MGSYVPTTAAEREEMLAAIGVKSLEDLYQAVPQGMLLNGTLNIPGGMSELEVREAVTAMAEKNKVYKTVLRGAGAYRHFIPAVVKSITSREELVTCYTPYQAEISQGVLQGTFEFQTMICELTGMDVANASHYDGANLNAVMGVVRPGDMGFDCIHSNLHKTFATPHGGGGPGAGAVGCKDFLRKYMPGPLVVEKDGRFAFDYPEKSIGRVKLFYGNFDVCIKALTYVLTLGRAGIPEAAMNAVLNANYMRVKLAEKFTMAYDEICMHEFVMSLVDLHKETGVSALDLAKGMLDYGLHPPTMYFPLIVHEALMVEPCETESKETMDEVCDIYGRLFDLAYSDPDALHTAPHDTPVRRLDEVGAARNMILRYSFAQ